MCTNCRSNTQTLLIPIQSWVALRWVRHLVGRVVKISAMSVSDTTKGSDTPESFLSKVAFESNLRKKLSRIEHVLIVKVFFERRKIAKVFMTHVQVFFRKSLSKATFENFLVCH